MSRLSGVCRFIFFPAGLTDEVAAVVIADG